MEAAEVATVESMTTLVTGANGFVGSHVARLLVTRSHKVRVLLRPTSQLGVLESLPVERVYGDLRDAASLERCIEGVNNVFHVAADYRLWAKNPDEIYETNVTGTRNLVDASIKGGVRRFIYTSTVGTIAVPRHGRLPDESANAALADMIGHYKKSKFLAEQNVLKAAEDGFPAVIVNPTTPVGPGDWKPTPTGRIILDFINGRMPAYVDTGMNMVPVEDVAEGHWLAFQHGRVGQRYLLGGLNMTLKQVLEVVASVAGRAAPRIRLPHSFALAVGYAESLWSSLSGSEPRIPLEGVRMARHKMFVDCSRATRELGFQPGSVEGALERAVRWYVENGYTRFVSLGPEVQSRNPLPLGEGGGPKARG